MVCSRADDLIPEESDTVLLALKRLPPKEAYDRVFRLRRAFQVCLHRGVLPGWAMKRLRANPSAPYPTNYSQKTSKRSQRRWEASLCLRYSGLIMCRITRICHQSSRRLNQSRRSVMTWRRWLLQRGRSEVATKPISLCSLHLEDPIQRVLHVLLIVS